MIDGEAWYGWWIGYIAFRERKIAAGEWLSNRPYSAAEAEDYRDGAWESQSPSEDSVSSDFSAG